MDFPVAVSCEAKISLLINKLKMDALCFPKFVDVKVLSETLYRKRETPLETTLPMLDRRMRELSYHSEACWIRTSVAVIGANTKWVNVVWVNEHVITKRLQIEFSPKILLTPNVSKDVWLLKINIEIFAVEVR